VSEIRGADAQLRALTSAPGSGVGSVFLHCNT